METAKPLLAQLIDGTFAGTLDYAQQRILWSHFGIFGSVTDVESTSFTPVLTQNERNKFREERSLPKLAVYIGSANSHWTNPLMNVGGTKIHQFTNGQWETLTVNKQIILTLGRLAVVVVLSGSSTAPPLPESLQKLMSTEGLTWPPADEVTTEDLRESHVKVPGSNYIPLATPLSGNYDASWRKRV